jgi:hypothetical protein
MPGVVRRRATHDIGEGEVRIAVAGGAEGGRIEAITEAGRYVKREARSPGKDWEYAPPLMVMRWRTSRSEELRKAPVLKVGVPELRWRNPEALSMLCP